MSGRHTNIEVLFRTHFEALHRYAFSILKDADAAKDMVQAVFLKLLEKQELIAFAQSARSYLFKSVYHECLNQLKKEKSLVDRHEAYAYVQGNEQAPDAAATAADIKERIDRVLAQLPPQCRTVFVKSRAEQKKYVEIAAELDISVKTVEAHMSKALKLVRATLRVFIIIVCLIIEWKYRPW
ncbi:MAG TPA: RNA polymerase sigma-70 factor [Edaphocola sp.]|nr:RNA polymerase sigma-70 factor [Edaphocola sp.]